MRWVVEYYEQADTTQPAEEFEISLKRHHKKLSAKLRAIAAAIEVYGRLVGVLLSHAMNTRACGRYARFLMDFSGENFSDSTGNTTELYSYMAT